MIYSFNWQLNHHLEHADFLHSPHESGDYSKVKSLSENKIFFDQYSIKCGVIVVVIIKGPIVEPRIDLVSLLQFGWKGNGHLLRFCDRSGNIDTIHSEMNSGAGVIETTTFTIQQQRSNTKRVNTISRDGKSARRQVHRSSDV